MKGQKRKGLNFERALLPYVESLYSTAYRLVLNPQDAEDLVQETFMKAFKYFDKFEKGTNIRAWLFKILKNTFINLYRKKKKTLPQIDFSEIEENCENLIITQNKIFEYTEELSDLSSIDEEIKKALDGLPEEYRKVIIMADIEGKSYKEIADKLNLPLGTVMSRLYRGRKNLEETLLNYAHRYGYIKGRKPKKQRRKIL